MTQSLLQRVEDESKAAGLTVTNVKTSERPGQAGGDHVVGHLGPLLVRFVRDRGQDWIEFGPADAVPPCFFSFQDVQIALGWKSIDQVLDMQDVEPLSQVLRLVADRWPELVRHLSGGAASVGWERVQRAANARSEAFVDRLR